MSAPPLLAIVGASGRAAAASAMRAGFQVAAADLFADADLSWIAAATRVKSYPDGLCDWLKQLSPRPDAWIYTGALENYPVLVDAIATVAPLWGNCGSVLRRVRSPLQLAETLRRAGLRFPEVCLVPDGLPRDGSWLAKTGRGGGGGGVRAFDRNCTTSPGVFYQRRVPGLPYSATVVAARRKTGLLGVVRQLVGEDWLGAREFQFCGAIGPCRLGHALHEEIEQIGRVLAQEFGLMGLFGVDLMIDDQQIWTVEVNPRYTASVEIIERATGVHAISAHAFACQDGEVLSSEPRNSSTICGKAILFASRSVAVGSSFADSALSEATQPNWPALADIPSAGTTISNGHPVLTVFAESASSDEVAKNLRNRVAEIERTIYSD
jgi:predicted ATP-grasp superfamily ATP-dependent carboligase